MATISNQRSTVLGIVNDCFRRMNFDPVATLSANRASLKYTSFLNDVVQLVSDYGNWPQEFSEVTVTSNACATQVEINASAPIKRIHQIHVRGQKQEMYPVPVEEIRVLTRSSATGQPRNFALVDASGINPRIRVHPRRTSATGYNVACYTMPLAYVSSDASKIPPWSKTLLVHGLMAQVYADEAGGEISPASQREQTMFQLMLKEEWNRWNADTGYEVSFYPG